MIDDSSRWQGGECGTYARTLQMVVPGLKVAVIGTRNDPDSTDDYDWWPHHYYAHDGTIAYDSLGRHPMPYMGLAGKLPVCDYIEDNIGDESGELPGQEGDYVGDALMHILTHDIYPGLTLERVLARLHHEDLLQPLGELLLELLLDLATRPGPVPAAAWGPAGGPSAGGGSP